MKKYSLDLVISIIILAMLMPAVALANSHQGYSFVTVTPSTVAPGDFITVEFEYTVTISDGASSTSLWAVILGGVVGQTPYNIAGVTLAEDQPPVTTGTIFVPEQTTVTVTNLVVQIPETTTPGQYPINVFSAAASFQPVAANAWYVEPSSGQPIMLTVEDQQDTTPPEITCPGDTTIEAMQPEGVPIDDDRIQAFLDGVSAIDDTDPNEAIVITNDAPSLFPPGDTTVTFTATDTSGNSSTCQSTVTVVEAAEANVRVIPRFINRDGRLNRILTVIRFPLGTAVEDIDIDQPIILFPGDSLVGVESTNQRVVSWTRNGTLRVSVFAVFPKDDVTAEVPEDGQVEMMAIGRFTSGQYFYGFSTARIISWSW